ncbi:MAG TPA: CPBP family intramembrane metalloprotease [Candidatus Hydrogenedentes bacterium]|nr:CPBP family intramembrane metalloprotease [Candidatus Hydrogenedentota bacterium]HIJ73292.1 CPBP family intramembrane metalloprotease [Candidatus Hydrogenedentota bacterium]
MMARAVGASRRLWGFVRGEGERVGFAWGPTLLVAWAAAALVVPHYHRGDWDRDFLRWAGGAGLAKYCMYARLDLSFLLQFCVPVLGIWLAGVAAPVSGLLLRRKDAECPTGLASSGPVAGLSSYGLGLGDVKFGLKATLTFYLLYVPCFIIFFRSAGFQEYYGARVDTAMTLHKALCWDIPSVFFSMVRTEFFFRGLLLFGFKRRYGTYAGVLASMIPYVLVHFGKPEIETFGSFPVGLALAYLAARTGSIWYGVLLHWSIALMLSGLLLVLQ